MTDPEELTCPGRYATHPCQRPVPPGGFACFPCWRRLPQGYRTGIVETWTAEGDTAPHVAMLRSARLWFEVNPEKEGAKT